MSEIARYDRIGTGYSLTRREDPSIARILRDALGDARSAVDVDVDVGAGTGSYEPPDLYAIAVEPSDVMAAQRPPEWRLGRAARAPSGARRLRRRPATHPADRCVLRARD